MQFLSEDTKPLLGGLDSTSLLPPRVCMGLGPEEDGLEIFGMLGHR